MQPREIEQKIQAALPDARVDVRDMTGMGDHFEVRVVSTAFSGKSRIEQHRMIYAALGDAMAGPIHALALKTEVPRV